MAYLFILTLGLPGAALFRLCQNLDPRYLLAYLGIINLLSLAAMFVDKKRAQKNQWRIPEAQLHLLECLGGWVGSWIAQIRFRHKTQKVSYQTIYWIIVVIHQIVALDYLWGGRLRSLL